MSPAIVTTDGLDLVLRETGDHEVGRLPATARSRLFLAMPGAVFRRLRRGLAHAFKVRQPADAVLNTAADEGLRPLDPV